MEVKKKLISEIIQGVNTEIKPGDFFEMEQDFYLMIREAYNIDF